jgi:hypothetical protein
VGRLASAAWLVLFVLKLAVLIRVFALRVSFAGLLLPVLAAAGVVVGPHVLTAAPWSNPYAHLAMTWYAIILVSSWIVFTPSAVCRDDLDEWAATVLRRAVGAAWILWAVFYAVHLVGWTAQFSVRCTPAHGVALLTLFVLAVDGEMWSWLLGMAALALGLVRPSLMTSPAALIVGVAFCVQALRLRASRLWVAAILAVHFAVWTMGWGAWPLPLPAVWLSLTTAAVLALLAWRGQMPFALVVACLVAAPCVLAVLPQSRLEWGIVITALGFLTLIVGIAVSWDLRDRDE